MRGIFRAILFSSTLLVISSGVAQTPDSKEEQRLLVLINEVQTQQAQIADNQTKIDAKLAEVAETVRVARIYSKREK